MTEKNILKMKKLFVGLCAVSAVLSLCITPFVPRNNLKGKIAGAGVAMLGGIGMGIALGEKFEKLTGPKERD